MSNRQDAIHTIQDLLKAKYDIDGEPDEFGANYKAKDGTHKVHMTHSTISFTSATNPENAYSFGYTQHMSEIRNIIRNTPDFSDTGFKAKREEVEKKKPYHQREKKVGEAKGPSIRSMIFEGLGAGKTQEAIIAELVATFKDKDEKALKLRFYGHKSEWNKKQAETPAPASPVTPTEVNP